MLQCGEDLIVGRWLGEVLQMTAYSRVCSFRKELLLSRSEL
jgi:hypothetical protein